MDCLNQLKELLTNQCNNSERYRPHLLEMEALWKEIKTYHNYVPNDTCIELFEPTEVRLKNAEEMLQTVKNNPASGMTVLLKQVERNLRDWISDNQYGYVMNFLVLENGFVQVEVSGLLSHHASYGNKTKDELYQEAIGKLKQEGFELCLDRNKVHHWFIDSDINRQKLTEKLKMLNSEFISFRSATSITKTNSVIREYKFRTHLYDLLQLSTKELKTRDILNADDYAGLHHDIGEFISAYSTIQQMPELTNTSLSVMEGIFANLCKTLKVETETSKEYYSRFAEERAKNERIREIEAEVSKIANFKDFTKIVAERLDTIKPILDKHDLFMDEFYLDCWGGATLVVTKSYLGMDKFQGFETFPAFGREDELEILDTEFNKKKFEELIPFFEVSGIELKIKDNHRCIQKITYNCRRFI